MTYQINLSGFELSTLKGALDISIQQLEKISSDFQIQLDDCPNPRDYRVLLNASVSLDERLNDLRSILCKVEGLPYD